MSNLKYYNESTGEWEYLVIGKQGPTGNTGPTGPTGEGVAAGGTTGQVLAKASGTDYDTEWADVSSGAWTLFSTTSLSGSANISINSINQTFKFLKIEIVDGQVGASGNVYLRFRNSTTNLANRYTTYVTPSPRLDNYSTNINIFIPGGGDMAASTTFNYEITLSNYGTAEFKPFVGFGAGETTGADGGFFAFGSCVSSSVVDSVELVSANSFTAGSIRIYGGN